MRYGLCCLPKENVDSPTGSSSSWDLDVGAKAGRFAVCWLLSRKDFSLGTLVQLSCLRYLLITYHRSCSSSRSDTTSASSCTSQPRVGAHESWRPCGEGGSPHEEPCVLPSGLGCWFLLTDVVGFQLANPCAVHCRYTREAYLELVRHVRDSIPGACSCGSV